MQIQIKDAHPQADGEYELDWFTLTNRELHLIHRLTDGLTPQQFGKALIDGNAALAVSMAMIATTRANKYVDEDTLWDAPGGSIKFLFPEDKGDAVPPAREPNVDAEEKKPTSGSDSSVGSASPEPDQSRSGGQTSDTASTSDLATLET